MGPECESRAGQTKTTSDSLGHRFECTLTITSPVHRELLASCRSGSCEKGSRIRAGLGLDGIEYYLVVDVCIVAGVSESCEWLLTCASFCGCQQKSTKRVQNSPWVTAIVVDDIEVRNPLSKVGLDSVDTGVHQSMDQADIPLAGFRVCEIDNSHSRLPFVPVISLLATPRSHTHHCQTLPLGRLRKYPFLTPSLKISARWAM